MKIRHFSKESAIELLAKEEERLRDSSEQDKYYCLKKLPMIAYLANDTKKAAGYSSRLIDAIEKRKEFNDFIDHCNPEHYALTVQGKIAFDEGNIAQAKYYLEKSIDLMSPYGFPTLSPSMSLANDLLEINEIEAAKNYLRKCIYRSLTGHLQHIYWFALVSIGRKPDFGQNAVLHPHYIHLH